MAGWITAFLEELDRALDDASVEKTKQWWERYLKGAASFRGVKMADTRRIVEQLWSTHELDRRSVDELISLAQACFARPDAEEKLACVLLLAEHVLAELTVAHVPALSQPLVEGDISDWNACDWYCVKVLGPMVGHSRNPEEVAEAIASWRSGVTLWQRRAAAVAFVNLAPRGDQLYEGFTDLLLEVCHSNVSDPTRWSQTSVGWLLRELSTAEPDRVRSFVDTHPELSTEARTAATARL